MLLPHLFELLALVFLVTTVTAFPAQSSAFVGHTASLCHSEYARCLRQVHSTSLCRILLCSTYGSQCPPCETGDFTASTTTESTNKDDISAQGLTKRGDKPRQNYCIIICAHAYCRPLCTNPPTNGDSTTNTISNAAITETTNPLAATNAQPDQLGIPLAPNTSMIVLGQKDSASLAQKCAWFCSADFASCAETCWDPVDTHGAVTTDVDDAQDASPMTGECEVVTKDALGPLIICPIRRAADFSWADTRCVLSWTEQTPRLQCRKV